MKEISETDIHTIFDDFKRRRRYNLAKAILDYLMNQFTEKALYELQVAYHYCR